VHADIKTANALLSTNGSIKIGDFGTSKKLKDGEKLYVMCGTPAYMAPEVIAADPVERHGYDFVSQISRLSSRCLQSSGDEPPRAGSCRRRTRQCRDDDVRKFSVMVKKNFFDDSSEEEEDEN
jgi:serine/threonine protein kinase